MWDRLRNLTYSGSTAKGQNSSESPARQRILICFLRRGPGPSGPCRTASTRSPPPRSTIHIHLRSPTQSSPVTQKVQNPAALASRKPPSLDIAGEERVLQDIAGEVLAQGVWITRARRLRGQELVEVRPGIRIAFMNALSHKHCEGATTVIKAAIRKELAKRE